jgi:hypothetical protein
MRCLASFGTRRTGRHLGLGSHGCGTTTMQFIYLCSSRAPEEFPDCILPPIESFPHFKNLAFAKAAKHKGHEVAVRFFAACMGASDVIHILFEVIECDGSLGLKGPIRVRSAGDNRSTQFLAVDSRLGQVCPA